MTTWLEALHNQRYLIERCVMQMTRQLIIRETLINSPPLTKRGKQGGSGDRGPPTSTSIRPLPRRPPGGASCPAFFLSDTWPVERQKRGHLKPSIVKMWRNLPFPIQVSLVSPGKINSPPPQNITTRLMAGVNLPKYWMNKV